MIVQPKHKAFTVNTLHGLMHHAVARFRHAQIFLFFVQGYTNGQIRIGSRYRQLHHSCGVIYCRKGEIAGRSAEHIACRRRGFHQIILA